MRKPTAAVSVVLLLLLSVAVAEASLAALLLLFSSILRLYMVVEVGGQVLQMAVPGWVPVPQVAVHNPGTIASFVFTLA